MPERRATAPNSDTSALLHKEGYLYKKSSKVAPKIPGGGWKRLWFRLEGGVLYYQKASSSSKAAKGKGDTVAINLLICTVRCVTVGAVGHVTVTRRCTSGSRTGYEPATRPVTAPEAAPDLS